MRIDNRPSDPRVLRDLANSAGPQETARAQAAGIRRDARRFAPRKSGNLARNITVEEFTDLDTGVVGFAVGWNDKAFYGPWVEGGDENQAPQPHLVPAVIKNGGTA